MRLCGMTVDGSGGGLWKRLMPSGKVGTFRCAVISQA
jgi:hypothetical protein